MNRQTLSLIIALTLFTNSSIAQNGSCAFDGYLDKLAAEDPSGFQAAQNAHHSNIDYYRQQNSGPYYITNPSTSGNALSGGRNCTRADYILPVVVHILYQGGNAITPSQVDNQLATLNNAFKNAVWDGTAFQSTGIQFCLAKTRPDSTAFNGITTHQTSKAVNTVFDLQSLMNIVSYDPARYINIYVVDDIQTTPGINGNVGGYASYPYPTFSHTYDGIVVDKDWFGDYAALGNVVDPQSGGKVLVHEMGHYLGLYHPWKDQCNGGYDAADGCDQKGDKCCDTPPMDVPNTTCQIPPNTCTGDTFPDPVENHMAYGTDACRDRFTSDQVSIMWSVLDYQRNGLWQVPNVNYMNLSCCVNAIALSGDNFGCTGSPLSLSTYEYPGAIYQWAIRDQGGVAQAIQNNGSTVTATLNNAGTYTVTLTISFAGGGSVSKTFTDYLEVADCTPLPSTQANWYFGKYAGLKFTTSGVIRDVKPYFSSPIFTPGINQIHTNEGSVSISDSMGALLFYGAGDTSTATVNRYQLFNSSYETVTTNGGLVGNTTASQGTFALPKDIDHGIYYLIHGGGSASDIPVDYYYSIIDVPGNKTLKKNIRIDDNLVSTFVGTEAISALPRCGDSTFWMIIPRFPSSFSTEFALFTVDKDTLLYHSSQPFYHAKVVSGNMLKFSPDGTHFACGNSLYKFDRKTGNITFRYEIQGTELSGTFSSAFSPDSKKWYTSGSLLNNNSTSVPPKVSFIHQFDLEYKEIGASQRLVRASEDYNAIMLGPDSMIYLSGYNRPYVSRIELPNERISIDGNECQLVSGAVALSKNGIGGVGTLGFPNNMEGLPDIAVIPDFRYAVDNCSQVSFESNQCCAATYLWDFGDGNTSTAKNPTHTYTSGGSYTVSINTDGEVVSRLIELNLSTSNLSITGASVFCDTTLIYDYEVTNGALGVLNPDFTYTWSTTYGQVAYLDSEYSSGILWTVDDTLKVLIKNEKDECEASLSLVVSKEIGEVILNTIDTSQVVCGPAFIKPLTSKEPRGDVSYQWYQKMPTDNSWTLIIGANSHNFTPIGVDSIAEFLLVANKGCTVSESNIVTIRVVKLVNKLSVFYPPKISNGGECKKGVYGTSESLFGLSDSIVWDESFRNKDGTFDDWQTKANSNQKDYSLWVVDESLERTNGYGSLLRRRVVFGRENELCEDTSHAAFLDQAYIVSKDWQDTSFCNSNGDTVLNMGFVVHLTPNMSLIAKWSGVSILLPDSVATFSIPIPAVGVKKKYTADIIPYYYDSQPTVPFSPTCSEVISSGNSFSYLNSQPDINVSISNSAPFITQQPVDKTTVVGATNISFTTSVASDANLSYLWESSTDNGVTWIQTKETTRVFNIGRLDECHDGLKLRCVISNLCGTVTSNVANLTVNGQNPSNASDIWMRDSWKDTGDEPNIFDNHYNIVRSPDMWNRQAKDNGLEHEDMEYKQFSPNELYVKVRNLGTDSTVSTPLYLYWTLGQINNEEWDIRWLDKPVNRFINDDSARSFPMGRRINEAPIMVPPIAPGDSLIVSHSWYPPNPSWYYRKDAAGNKVGDFGNRLSVCVLARLEECDVYPHKMHTPEVFGQHVKINAARNNNIVTKNIWVVNNDINDLVDTDFDGVIDWVRGSWTGMGRQQLPSWDVRPCFDAISPSFFTHWRVAIEVEDVIRDAILNITAINNNITYLGSNIFSLGESSYRCIDELSFPDDQVHFFRPLFAPVNGWASIPEETFEVGLAQYNSFNEVDGAGSFLIDNRQAQFSDLAAQSQNNTSSGSNHLLLSPNPTNGQISIELDEATKVQLAGQYGTIIIADGFGYTHFEIQNIPVEDVTILQLSGYSAGVYNVRFEINGQVFYKYVVKTDE